ncbi:hypothetical protein GJ496_007577 [Pomphorhynchus laevis]|nr:hypothetical protein GJ496_007577 [Pomphorhynchus laevis]
MHHDSYQKDFVSHFLQKFSKLKKQNLKSSMIISKELNKLHLRWPINEQDMGEFIQNDLCRTFNGLNSSIKHELFQTRDLTRREIVDMLIRILNTLDRIGDVIYDEKCFIHVFDIESTCDNDQIISQHIIKLYEYAHGLIQQLLSYQMYVLQTLDGTEELLRSTTVLADVFTEFFSHYRCFLTRALLLKFLLIETEKRIDLLRQQPKYKIDEIQSIYQKLHPIWNLALTIHIFPNGENQETTIICAKSLYRVTCYYIQFCGLFINFTMPNMSKYEFINYMISVSENFITPSIALLLKWFLRNSTIIGGNTAHDMIFLFLQFDVDFKNKCILHEVDEPCLFQRNNTNCYRSILCELIMEEVYFKLLYYGNNEEITQLLGTTCSRFQCSSVSLTAYIQALYRMLAKFHERDIAEMHASFFCDVLILEGSKFVSDFMKFFLECLSSACFGDSNSIDIFLILNEKCTKLLINAYPRLFTDLVMKKILYKCEKSEYDADNIQSKQTIYILSKLVANLDGHKLSEDWGLVNTLSKTMFNSVIGSIDLNIDHINDMLDLLISLKNRPEYLSIHGQHTFLSILNCYAMTSYDSALSVRVRSISSKMSIFLRGYLPMEKLEIPYYLRSNYITRIDIFKQMYYCNDESTSALFDFVCIFISDIFYDFDFKLAIRLSSTLSTLTKQWSEEKQAKFLQCFTDAIQNCDNQTKVVQSKDKQNHATIKLRNKGKNFQKKCFCFN